MLKVKFIFVAYNRMSQGIRDYEVIKHIGKGSFSNVYLCRNEIPLHIGNMESDEEFFIIKEININELVKSYMIRRTGGSTVRRVNKNKNETGDIQVNITPYKNESELVNTEQDYYFQRLQELIESEIEILSVLDHPNIIKYYGHTKDNGIYYLRMEYCNGGDVYDFLKSQTSERFRNSSGGFTNSFLYEFLNQTINGLKYIHDKNIIHRDIKLHNVLIKHTHQGIEFKISDFGFACYDLCGMNNKDIDWDDILCKKYYKLCGTPYYMAPEIILNMNKMENITMYKQQTRKSNVLIYNKRIDIWSLGICIYELMFNLLPFSNIKNINDLERFYKLENIQDIMNKKITRRIGLRDDFKTIMYKMMTVDKNERCSVNEIYNFLQETRCVIDLVNDADVSANVMDVINCRENTYIKNEDMKRDIVTNPVKEEYGQFDLSWEKINKSSSIIMKMSVQKGFLNWLFNKK
jgi:serine/threonine protein kinase